MAVGHTGGPLLSDQRLQGADQSAKTQTVINCACWAIAEDPGPAMWVTATKDELLDFLRDRLTPTFEACRCKRPPRSRWDAGKEVLADSRGLTQGGTIKCATEKVSSGEALGRIFEA